MVPWYIVLKFGRWEKNILSDRSSVTWTEFRSVTFLKKMVLGTQKPPFWWFEYFCWWKLVCTKFFSCGKTLQSRNTDRNLEYYGTYLRWLILVFSFNGHKGYRHRTVPYGTHDAKDRMECYQLRTKSENGRNLWKYFYYSSKNFRETKILVSS